MKSRKEIIEESEELYSKIDKLRQDVRLLKIELYQTVDEDHRYEEKLETFGRGKHKKEIMIGRHYWNEEFQDQETGEKVIVERSCVVRQNGEWQV